MVLASINIVSAAQDTTAPKATSGSPARNAINIPVTTLIKTTFNENIYAGSTYSSIKLKHKQGSSYIYDTVSVSIEGNVLKVTPSSKLAKRTTYTLVLPAGSLTDLAGNPIAAYSRSFTTKST